MAQSKRQYTLNYRPEVNLAHRLYLRLKLEPPVDIEALVKRYADLEVVKFPVDVDGVCLDLKVPGRRPRVVVNSRKPPNRVRFTLAHELGHLLIPWHVGSIVDETDAIEEGLDDYWDMEAEANRFASELLMPSAWIQEQFEAAPDPLTALSEISQRAAVSLRAAIIKMMELVKGAHIIAQLDAFGTVSFSMRSANALANRPPVGSVIDDVFPWAQQWRSEISGKELIWWEFPREKPLPDVQASPQQWRDLLDQIVTDLDHPDPKAFKASLNGVIALANGSTRSRRTPEALLSASLQRLQSRGLRDPSSRSS
jgi:hypothetical protein